MFALGKLFLTSLMFANKAGALPSVAPFKCSYLGRAAGLTPKQSTRLEQGQIVHLIMKNCKLLTSKAYNIIPRLKGGKH